ncbi:hypothetical protein E2C01_089307 [Portunus trituberculatus]|uniref:Uncharacterized protein n=1 Tax=Portunus trituberculatus TaxID=210409 RepID=A0A5B7JIG4_PORTR|nr:hypothetical protein [Portunus trituberculatus]
MTTDTNNHKQASGRHGRTGAGLGPTGGGGSRYPGGPHAHRVSARSGHRAKTGPCYFGMNRRVPGLPSFPCHCHCHCYLMLLRC